MAAPKVIELWVHFLTQKPAAPNSSRDPSYGSAKSSLKIVVNFGRRSRAVPLYVEQGSLLYRTGQQFSKSSLGRLETDQLSRVGIGSSFRATATLDPVWEYSLRIGKSSVDEGASAPEQRAVFGFNLGQFCDASRKLLRLSSNSYLVDPASSHMLVSKIKPCMSKYKPH